MNQRFTTELEPKRDTLTTLCRKYGVARLDLFGSGAEVFRRTIATNGDLFQEVAFVRTLVARSRKPAGTGSTG